VHKLWEKVRKAVMLNKFIFASREQASLKAHNLMGGYDFDDIDLDLMDGGSKVKSLKWYYIRESNMIP